MIRWLVAGYGNAGKCHIAAISKVKSAALAGIAAPYAVDAPKGVPVFDMLEEAIEGTRPDAVIIATPHDTHSDLSISALGAGIPVLCEKPVGRNAQDALAIVAAAAVANVPVGVVLNQRACVHARWIKQLLVEGNLDRCAAAVHGILGRLAGWHADPAKAGGGLLRTIGIHYLDLLCWWFGAPLCAGGTMNGLPAESAVQLVLSFSGDRTAGIWLSAIGERAAGPVSVFLESETGRIKLCGHEIVACEGFPAPPPAERTPGTLRYGPGHTAVIEAATASLLEGKGFPIPLAEVLPLLELVDALYTAASEAGVFIHEPRPRAETYRAGVPH